LEKKTKRNKKEKLKEKAKSSSGVANKVVKTRSTTLSPSSYSSTIFDEIAPIPSFCASNLVGASKIPMHLDV
jgi:hypothetical protein